MLTLEKTRHAWRTKALEADVTLANDAKARYAAQLRRYGYKRED